MKNESRTLCPARSLVTDGPANLGRVKPVRCILSNGHRGGHTNGVHRWTDEGQQAAREGGQKERT
jgi:hypothetical protein